MSVKIRLTRRGRKKIPFYRVVASESKFARDGRNIENLGFYDPISKKISLKKDRIEHFLKNGAIASDTVKRLLKSQA